MIWRPESGVTPVLTARQGQVTDAEPYVNVNRIHKWLLRIFFKKIERKCLLEGDL